ncbi:GreA/GreB family elongation factor [Chloroflexota bacterium]
MAATKPVNPILSEAAEHFLTTISPENMETYQAEVYRFVRWFGTSNKFTTLAAHGIANYAEQLSLSDVNYGVRLKISKSFLSYAKKCGWCQASLSPHLKAKKVKTKVKAKSTDNPSGAQLTAQGYAEMQTELSSLREKSLELVEQIQKAAADKDFRENAPLHAAREERGHIEGRIVELTELLKDAIVVDADGNRGSKVGFGDMVTLVNTTTGQELCYTIVHPKETNPTEGKISSESPLGNAILGRDIGESVAVNVPAGKSTFTISKLKH